MRCWLKIQSQSCDATGRSAGPATRLRLLVESVGLYCLCTAHMMKLTCFPLWALTASLTTFMVARHTVLSQWRPGIDLLGLDGVGNYSTLIPCASLGAPLHTIHKEFRKKLGRAVLASSCKRLLGSVLQRTSFSNLPFVLGEVLCSVFRQPGGRLTSTMRESASRRCTGRASCLQEF